MVSELCEPKALSTRTFAIGRARAIHFATSRVHLRNAELGYGVTATRLHPHQWD